MLSWFRTVLLLLALCTQSPFSFEHFRRRRAHALIGHRAVIHKEPHISKYVLGPVKRLVEVELHLTEL